MRRYAPFEEYLKPRDWRETLALGEMCGALPAGDCRSLVVTLPMLFLCHDHRLIEGSLEAALRVSPN